MAKKQSTTKKTASKSRLETRVDEELAGKFKEIAETAGISVNQLLQGLVVWAVDNAVQGTPVYDERTGEVTTEPRQGCLYFGHESAFIDEETNEYGEVVEGPYHTNGKVHFVLDFSYQNAIRER
ncbi:hypothetical protein [Roseimaritima ulvae]|uniref:Uncharacterized protein n=1 Tax=Roseimaritima ulvae TaxID=980254 RepID=A0A5B9QWR6_9BACT|nr:hypothetical protein [Roseimaritima ulvae]QEG41825.1 hypothetical protein UC8_38530 [Roseimaritima ulvae]